MFTILSIRSRCGTFATPNTKMELYEMCQISKIIQHGYSTVANLQRYGQMLQKIYYFIFPFLSPLSSFFLFSSLSLSGSLSLLPVPVPSLFDQSGKFTVSDDGVAPKMTARSATLDLAPATQSHSSHSISATLNLTDLTPSPPSISRSATLQPLYLSLVVGFFFFFTAIWVDMMVVVGCGLWAVTVAVVVGCGGDGPLL